MTTMGEVLKLSTTLIKCSLNRTEKWQIPLIEHQLYFPTSIPFKKIYSNLLATKSTFKTLATIRVFELDRRVKRLNAVLF